MFRMNWSIELRALSLTAPVEVLRRYGLRKKELFVIVVISALLANYLTDVFYLALDTSSNKHNVKAAINALITASTMFANTKVAQSQRETEVRRQVVDSAAKLVILAGTFLAGVEWLLSGTDGLTLNSSIALLVFGAVVAFAGGISEDDAKRAAVRRAWAMVGQRRNRAWAMESDMDASHGDEPGTGGMPGHPCSQECQSNLHRRR